MVAILLQSVYNGLTHEVLSTLVEAMAITNARLLVPVSADPDMPAVLKPAMILHPLVTLTQQNSIQNNRDKFSVSQTLFRKR